MHINLGKFQAHTYKDPEIRKFIRWDKNNNYQAIYTKYPLKDHLLGIPSVIRPYFYLKFFPKGNLFRFMAAIGSNTFWMSW